MCFVTSAGKQQKNAIKNAEKTSSLHTNHNVTVKCCLALFFALLNFLLSRILAFFLSLQSKIFLKPNPLLGRTIANLLWIN